MLSRCSLFTGKGLLLYPADTTSERKGDLSTIPTCRSGDFLHPAVVGTASFAVQLGVALLDQLGKFVF